MVYSCCTHKFSAIECVLIGNNSAGLRLVFFGAIFFHISLAVSFCHALNARLSSIVYILSMKLHDSNLSGDVLVTSDIWVYVGLITEITPLPHLLQLEQSASRQILSICSQLNKIDQRFFRRHKRLSALRYC